MIVGVGRILAPMPGGIRNPTSVSFISTTSCATPLILTASESEVSLGDPKYNPELIFYMSTEGEKRQEREGTYMNAGVPSVGKLSVPHSS